MKSSIISQPIVQFNHVSFIRNHNTILNDISFRIEKGQHWAIIGPNGSGKTSLVSIINGYHQPSEGIVEVHGTKMEVMTGEVLSKTFDLKIEVLERGGRLWVMIL